MKPKLAVLLVGVVIACTSAAAAESDTHRIFLPEDIKWAPAPASLPWGADAAVLYGEPAKEGMFALRIKAPKGYRIPPHTHPKPEVVTVITGKIRLGMGPKADSSKAQILPSGSVFSMPADTPHYMLTDEDAVVQINAIGPWGTDYVDPRDDPRLNIAPARKGSDTRPE